MSFPYRDTHGRRACRRSALFSVLFLHLGTATADVMLNGLAPELRDNALLLMALDDEPCDAPAWRIDRLFEAANAEITRALEAYGHYGATIQKSLSDAGDCWRAEFEIDAGPEMLLRQVDIAVKTSEPLAKGLDARIASQPFKSGDTLRHPAYDAYKKSLLDRAVSLGYFDARFTTQKLDVYPRENLADINLVFAPGDRYRIGELRFNQDVVAPELVDRYSTVETGQPYSAKDIGNLYDGLLASGYFESISIATEPSGAPDYSVATTVTMTPAKRIAVETGVGFGTDTGLRLRTGYLDRRRNRQGHQLNADASWSRILSEIGAGYRIPLDNPRAEWLGFDTGYRDEDTDTAKSQTFKLGIKELKLRRFGWLETRFVDVLLEDFNVAGDRGNTRLITPGLSWTHVSSNGAGRPARGHRLNLRVNGAMEALASDTTFAQFDVFGKLIRSAWSGGRILVRGEFGATAKDDFSELPASVRYFVGGDTSVRGYDYETLGPRDADGNVVGGSHKLAFGVELDQRLRENWGIAAFVDAGNAFDEFDSINTKISAGFGVRWYSFLGPIRLDVAVPLDDDADDSFRIHVNLGPDL